MTEKTKRRFQNSIIYIILALLIVAMICIAIAASLTGADEPTPTLPPVTNQNPVQNPTPDTQNPLPDTDTDASPTLTFVTPLAGAVTKVHDAELLVMSETMKDYRVHLGLDIEANIGTAVTACADGVVKHVYADPFMGMSVVVDHGNGITSIYQNLAETVAEGIAEGVSVKAGDLLGAVGESARLEIAQEPHLHFEMTKDGASVDPLDYVPYSLDVNTDASYEDQ